jgi:hypothetical protein
MHDRWNIRGAAFFDSLIWKATISLITVQEFCLNLVINVKAEKIARQTCDPHHYPMQLRPQSDPLQW